MYFLAILNFAKRLPLSKYGWGRKSQTMNLIEHQGNKVREIGFLLKEARSNTSLSLEEVAAQTLLRTGLLSAIEKGDLHELPEPIYVQALIRQYANFLGLDGDRLADSIPNKHMELNKDREWSVFLPVLTQLRPLHLYAIYVVLIAIAVNSLSAMVDSSKQDTSPIALPPIQEQIATTPSPKDKALISPSPLPKPSQPIVVNATLKFQSWVRVVADEQTIFEGVIDEGNQRTWTAKQKLSIRAGNAGALIVGFNENSPKPMGNVGEVQEITFTPDTLAQPLPSTQSANNTQTPSSQTSDNQTIR